MNLEQRLEKAVVDKKKGHNCAQVVACAFADKYDIDESTLLKVSEAFGGGMGIMSVCGAVSGMLILAGLENADGNLDENTTKKKTNAAGRELIAKFEEENKSIICRELKGIETKVVLASCEKCIADAIKIYNNYLEEKEA